MLFATPALVGTSCSVEQWQLLRFIGIPRLRSGRGLQLSEGGRIKSGAGEEPEVGRGSDETQAQGSGSETPNSRRRGVSSTEPEKADRGRSW